LLLGICLNACLAIIKRELSFKNYKMSIAVRKRPGTKGISRLWLDYNIDGKRGSETLDLYIIDRPIVPHEREANKQAKMLADQIKAQRILDLQAGKYNLYNKDKEDGSL
jgi:hypothetical protein